ncbi:DUF533 domain-containing protein [Croceibacterium ferulae]|uniref:DUF533 domain-containing protein n=1 Tax=Croceibacterium ferulae TaxID=1854641 RepID=UPI0019D45CD8|nr:DUF533 domain-containing protein [Croceibacterium ferulae]
MTGRDLARAPDGVANADWIAAEAVTPSSWPPQSAPVGADSPPAELRLRRVELALASKLLDAHLRNRRQLMQSDPADLTGLSPSDTRLLIRGMIAAAHADGAVSDEERQRLSKLVRSWIEDAAVRDQLWSELDAPPSIEQLIRTVGTPVLAERFYAVSVEIVGFDRPVERTYLAYLAARLDIAADVVLRINRERTGQRTRVREPSG